MMQRITKNANGNLLIDLVELDSDYVKSLQIQWIGDEDYEAGKRRPDTTDLPDYHFF